MSQDESRSTLRREVDSLRRELEAPETRLDDREIRARLERIGDLFLDMTGAASGPGGAVALPPSSGAR